MAVKVGGMYATGVSTRSANAACQELRVVNGAVDFSDYVVDLCFMTYVQDGLGASYAAGIGIRPGTVGRKQHRFIVKLEVPPTLSDRSSCAAWITDALAEVAELVGTYLPKKAKTYPVERLTEEVRDLRARWIVHVESTA